MDFLYFSLSLWIVLQTAKSQFDVGRLNCKTNVITAGCPWNNTCSGTCRFTCSDIPRKEKDSERQIWGTKTYTYYSSICKAATHDLRMSTWDKKELSFILQRVPFDSKHWASIRSGIRSYSYLNLPSPEEGGFIFVSPRVKEHILDVGSIHEGFLFGEARNHLQACLASNNAVSFSFKNFIREDPLSPATAEERWGNLTVYAFRWSDETGGFQCFPEKSTLSVVTSIAISANADFYPAQMTYVANVNDNVTLVMKEQSSRSSACQSTWKKDDEELPEFINQTAQQRTALFLPDVEEGSQGIYSLECNSDSTGRGLLRLIVRACPADTYGDNCTEQCPKCMNGGVCHDITGVCICPPGFSGTTCENSCPPGYFGQSCNITCPLKEDSQGPKPSCKGYLICLPDPYGCSCASGYKGISCNESYPVLTDGIMLKESTTNSITVRFRAWDSNLDIGNGTPSTYRVYFKRNKDDETWVSKDVDVTSISEKKGYEVTLGNLATDTEYAVRLVILDVSGRKQEEGVKEYLFSTTCDRPMKPPLNVVASAEEKKVSISWKLPPEKFWNCRTVSSVVKYRNANFFEVKSTNETSYSFSSKPYTKWEITICYGQINNDEDDDVSCAETKIVTTKEDAPGIVRDFKYTWVRSRSINLTWKAPLEENGVIKYFILRYQQMNWKHSCQEDIDKDIKELNISHVNVIVQNLNPSATYHFQIVAATVKEGPKNTLAAVTQSDVPSAGPTKLRFEGNNSFLSWKPPPCAKRNGEITKYYITVKGLNLSDQYQRNSISTEKFVMLPVLPSTHYNAKVFASTGAGFGETYTEINFKTPETAPTAPASLVVFERTENSIGIYWNPPFGANFAVQTYQVSQVLLKKSSTETNGDMANYQPSQTKTFDTEGLGFTFRDLRPATTYILSILPVYDRSGKAHLGPARSKIASTRIPIPKVSRVPNFLGKTEDSITVKIFPVTPQDGIVRYFVIVKEDETETDEETEVYYRGDEEYFFSPSQCKVRFDGNKYVAARLESLPPEGTNFIVGDGRCVHGFSNKPLTPGTYQVGIVVLHEYLEDKRYSAIRYITKSIYVGKKAGAPVDVYTIVLAVLIVLVFIVCVSISIFTLPDGFLLKARQTANQSLAMLPWRRRRRPPTPLAFVNTISEDDSDDDSTNTEPEEDISHVIAVEDLENYITEGLSNSDLKNQFKAIPRGHNYSCRVARHPNNRMKNRYGNLLPYDHSRVSLKSTHDDTFSEYINANYVSGYKNDKRYIATQGPLPKTVNDFWRMVWKENSCKIFMVTNLVEQGRKKCEKYWPDETSLFGSITVTLKNSQPLPDFVIRTFEISVRKQKRELKQYHYLTWPDHGTPKCTAPVVKFLKKARNFQPKNEAPIIVHCSAGVGRTGTLILLDSMLEMGMAEGKIDVCGHLCEMRKKRISLLENLEQYVFVYKALQQSLCWGETSVQCADLVPEMGILRKPDEDSHFTPLELQYKRLGKICPSLENVAVRTSRLPENAPKNRSMEILPPERARPILTSSTGEGPGYINAVYVNGYREKDAFLVTQYPLPNTIGDFWQMIYEKKSRTILLLQDIDITDPTCPQYWPSEGETVLHGEYRIQCISVKSFGDIRLWNLNLNAIHSKDCSNDSPVPIKLFQQLRWPVGLPLIEYPKSLLDMIEKVEKTQREGKHVVTVQCLNGSTASGVFCATMYVCSKMINEQEVDIFEAVQNIRINRPQFIESFEQYDFLYDMAITFLDNFGAYANFL